MVAATAWAAAEPLLRRVFRTPYSDVRLLGATVTRGRAWPVVGTAVHVANGAAFGFVWARLGGGGWKRGILLAELENLALWPGMALVDRYHPDRRSGRFPPLLRNRRVFAYEVATHAVFGAVLGLTSAPDPPDASPSNARIATAP
jgi:hypothetical protein